MQDLKYEQLYFFNGDKWVFIDFETSWGVIVVFIVDVTGFFNMPYNIYKRHDVPNILDIKH